MKTIVLTLLLTAVAAAEPASAEPDSAEHWLERIEDRAGDIDTLRARIHYTTIQGLLGDEQRRIGTLLYDDADPAEKQPTRFAVRFDRIIVDGSMQMQDRAYIYDGVWLGERIQEHDRKVFIRRQFAPEASDSSDAPEKDLLSLGEGPFALPLNLKKDQVLKNYVVTVIESDEDAPAHAVGLQLLPRPGVDIEQKQIDLWFHRETLLPVRVRTTNSDETESIINLRDLDVNPALDGETFDTTPPREAGWEIEIKPLDAPRL